jgi:hypothetical protein
MAQVTDEAVLAELNGPKAAAPAADSTVVTDPAVLAQLNGGKSPVQVAPLAEPQSAALYAIDKFKKGAAGSLSLANAPVSIIGAGLEMAGVIPKGETFGGMAMAAKGWEGVMGVKNLKAPLDSAGGESKATEYLGTVAEFAGGMLFPGGSAVAMASRKLATAIVTSVGTISSATTAVELKEVGGNLGPTVGLTKEQGQEIGYTLGSFVGQGIPNAVGQSVLKAAGATAGVLERNNITGLSKEAQRAAANGMVLKDIATGLEHSPSSIPNAARAIELKNKVEGFTPALAQMTNAPGIIAMYKEVANKSPEALAKAAAVDSKNATAIANYKEKVFPATSQAVTDPARIKLATDQRVAQMGLDKAQMELRVLSDKFRRTADNEAIGEQLRTKYWETRGSAKQLIDTSLANVYATARKFGVVDDMTDVRQAVQKIVGADKAAFQNMPPLFAKVLAEYPAEVAPTMKRVATTPQGALKPIYKTETTPGNPGKSEASFEELHSLYKEANKSWMDAVAAGNPTQAHYMNMVKGMLQQKVQRYNAPQFGELATKFTDWNSSYSKYSQTFKEGLGGELAKRTRTGLATDSEDIVSKIILQAGDKKKGVQDFVQLFGNNPHAAELLHEGMLDNFSKWAVRDGQINPARARSWMANHSKALEELPELRKALQNTEKTAQNLTDRMLTRQKERQLLDRSELAKVAQSDQPERLVQQAISNPKVMKALIEGAYTQESKKAIARAIADAVGIRGNSLEFLKANEASLKPAMDVLGKNHWQNLKDLAELEEIASRVKAPTAVELSRPQDLGESLIGTSGKGMLSRLRNLNKPMGTSVEYMLADVGGRFFYKTRTADLARLRESAMFDTAAAEGLLHIAKAKTLTKADLLNLQSISMAAGANSTVQAIAEQREDKEKKRVPQ